MNTLDDRIRALVSHLSQEPSGVELSGITNKVIRHQRRRKIGVISGALVASILSIAGLASAIGGSGPSFDPSGEDWVKFSNPAAGFAISYPSSWSRADSILTTHTPQELVALANFPLPASTGSGCAQLPEQALQAVGSRNALVLVWELPPVDSGVSSLPPRPETFTQSTGTSNDDSPQCVGGTVNFTHRLIAFQDQGRQFEAFVAVGKEAPKTTSDQAWEVLNTMTISSPTSSTESNQAETLPFIATAASTSGTSMTALMVGRLEDAGGCFILAQHGAGSLVIWPHGYSVGREPSGKLVLLDGKLKPLASEGERIRVGGGERRGNLNHKLLTSPIPTNCTGYSYWWGSTVTSASSSAPGA